MRPTYLTGAISLFIAVLIQPPGYAGDALAPKAVKRMADVLSERRVAPPEETAGGIRTRGPSLRDLYRTTVKAVPIVVAEDGTGSSVVVNVNPADRSALVVTNQHVVENPFQTEEGEPCVLLLFHDPELSGEPFSPAKIEKCVQDQEKSSFCDALRKSLRVAAILGTDPARDLALLHVTNVPPGVTPIRGARLDTVEPGDDVAVIGHPKGFLWSLTRGIVSAVRTKYPMGDSEGTVIQTQTPIAPGNSGGPLLTLEGQLVGVVTWQVGGTQGLNAAIAVNEVQKFAAELAAKARRK